jgi:hypothetical protein
VLCCVVLYRADEARNSWVVGRGAGYCYCYPRSRCARIIIHGGDPRQRSQRSSNSNAHAYVLVMFVLPYRVLVVLRGLQVTEASHTSVSHYARRFSPPPLFIRLVFNYHSLPLPTTSLFVRHGSCFARTAAAKTLSDPTSNVLEPYVWRDPERTVGRGIFIEVAQILHVDPFAIQALQDLVRAARPSFCPAAWVWWRARCWREWAVVHCGG